jgi:DNA polymerase beta
MSKILKKKDCKEGKILNPETQRCVSITSPLGKKLLAKIKSPKSNSPKKVSSPKVKKEEMKVCKEGKILNPETKRCVSITSAIGKKLLAKKKLSDETAFVKSLSSLSPLVLSKEKGDLKKNIIKHIGILRDYEKMKNHTYKARAYTSVLAQLFAYKEPILTYEAFAANIKAGDRINHKVKELIDTGKIKYEEENINQNSGFNFQKELMNIYGIGESKIKQILDKGIKSIDELRKNTNLLNEKQKIGLAYYDDLNKRIPLEEYLKHKEILEFDLKKFKLTYEFVGSFRRGITSMGDIDLLILKNDNFDLNAYIKQLKASGYVKEILALGSVKFSGIVKLDGKSTARQVDILIAPPEEYYYSLLYFTGSAEFNVGLRNFLKNKYNISLSEHGFKEPIIKIPTMKSEQEIFNFFNLNYIEPKKRKVFFNPEFQ